VNAADYVDAHITGVGVAPGESRIRFTVDATPDNVWVTDKYTGDQLNRLVSLIMVAYTSGKKIAFIRTDDDPSQSSYLNVVQFEVGAITHD
jgi:hypothetical protein